MVAGHSRSEAAVGPMASCVSAASSECGESVAAAHADPTQSEPSRENFRDTSVWGPRVEGHRSTGEGIQVRGRFDGSTRCGGPRSRGFASCAEAREGGEEAAGGRTSQRVRRILVTGPSTSCRAGCQEGRCELEHPRGRTAVGSVETNAAVHPASTSGRRRRIPAVASDSCSDEGAVARFEASIGGGPSTQARLQARRFRPHVRGRVAGVDRGTAGRSERGHVGGETRRGREDQQHHVSSCTTVATGSRSRNLAIHGVQQRQLRTSFGLRGVRVGEASHPGPTTKRRRMLRSSRRARDSDEQSSSDLRRGPTQVDSDSEDELPLAQVFSYDQSRGLASLAESPPVPSPSPPSELVRALESDLCSHPRASRRVVLVPQSPDGTPRSVHDAEDSFPSGTQDPVQAMQVFPTIPSGAVRHVERGETNEHSSEDETSVRRVSGFLAGPSGRIQRDSGRRSLHGSGERDCESIAVRCPRSR